MTHIKYADGEIVLAMERETGIEPATSSLGSLRSTPELLPLPQDECALPGEDILEVRPKITGVRVSVKPTIDLLTPSGRG